MRVATNGLELEYETFGDPAHDPMVLVMGFAQQLIDWDPRFCQRLAMRGFYVVRFDNRDVGLSSKLESAPRPKVGAILAGDLSTVAYSIDDMADDTAGLITALGFRTAHVVGVSMGGMIAQSLSIRYLNLVKSLASIMSTTGDPRVGQASPEIIPIVMKAPPADRQANIEQAVLVWRTLASPGFPFDEAGIRARSALAYDRCYYPLGNARQAAAILSQRDRTEPLRAMRAPAVVIHGKADRLIHYSGGEATARAIADAKLVLVEGMGHDLAEGVWPLLIDEITQNAERAT